ncbi:MAG: LysR family transcriptional regulator [Nannocystaceae bacterium]|nr:LysR family transcriptional regulator [Nannocystaceae bacterium]
MRGGVIVAAGPSEHGEEGRESEWVADALGAVGSREDNKGRLVEVTHELLGLQLATLWPCGQAQRCNAGWPIRNTGDGDGSVTSTSYTLGMDLEALRAVLQVFETGSLRGAAERLKLDTSTVSRRVRSLEASLGAKLFETEGRRQTPTRAGNVAIEAAREITQRVDRMQRELHGMDESMVGTVRLTASLATTRYELLRPLAEFRRLYPEIRLELRVTDSVLSLHQREADIAVRVALEPAPSLFGGRVGPIAYAFYASDSYLAQYAERGGPHHSLMWISGAVPEGWRALFPDAVPVMFFNETIAMVDAACEGIGMALLPAVVGEQDPRLRRVQTDPTAYGWSVWVLMHPDLKSNVRVRTLLSFLHDALGESRKRYSLAEAPTQ